MLAGGGGGWPPGWDSYSLLLGRRDATLQPPCPPRPLQHVGGAFFPQQPEHHKGPYSGLGLEVHTQKACFPGAPQLPSAPLHVMAYFEPGLVLSVLFPGWKPLGHLLASPLRQPTCVFPGCEGKSLEGTWAATLGPQPGEGLGGLAQVQGWGLAWAAWGMSSTGRGGLGCPAPAPPCELVSLDSRPGTRRSQQPADISQAG